MLDSHLREDGKMLSILYPYMLPANFKHVQQHTNALINVITSWA
jgi:hypothetical protein